MMEKHALNKLKAAYGSSDEAMPSVKLIGTFKDDNDLYFLIEMLSKEVWENCRSFGLLNDKLIRYTFYQICLSVKKLHDL